MQDGSLCEAVLPVECQVETIPGVWDTGAVEGSILVAALDADLTLEPGDVVAEVRAGCVVPQCAVVGPLRRSSLRLSLLLCVSHAG